MADICEIKRLLALKAQAVAEYLLPNGRKDGNEWRVGSVRGEIGGSLGVHLVGQKAGIWADFNTDDSGDLLDLWVATRGVPLATAIEDARGWLGIGSPRTERPVDRTWTRPPKPRCTAPANRVRDYLVEDRNLPWDVLERYRVGEDGDDIVFPFLLPDGVLAMAKRRPAVEGGKPKPTAADCEPILFGWQAVPDDAREIVITEGEIDALSMAAYGYAAMSVPFGGGGGAKQRWIESDYDRMDRFEVIRLAMDMDELGEQAAREIAARLGHHRCVRVNLPRKDASQCLTDGVSQEDIDAAITNAETYDPDGLRLPSTYADNVVLLFWPQPGTHVGYRTPYAKLGENLLFRPAEVTLWSGDSGTGKSQILSDCAVDWIKQDARVCLSSLEMKPAQTLKRMVKQASGTDRPTEPTVREALAWLDRGLILYELVGKAKHESLIEVFEYCRAKYGCDQFVIDSLMRLGIAGDDYGGQESAIYRLVEWAVEKSVHVHLVAHARKGARDRGAPETEDIKGAMELGANAFNIITVWRNRKLEEQIAQAEKVKDEDKLADLAGKPTVVLNVAKQRNGDYEGKIGLWFDKENYQYRSSFDRQAWPRCYIEQVEMGDTAAGAG